MRHTTRVLPVLLSVPLVFWMLIALYWFRVTPLFLQVHKLLGNWATWGIVAGFPLAAMVVGLRAARCGERGRLVRCGIGLAGLLTAAFITLIAIPLAARSVQPRTPKNPQVARPVAPPTGLPVFPGAQGFGTRTPAGRGGRVLEVVTLADDGPGSLREALDTAAPRTIVFRVAGTIELRSPLFISQPFVTVAGQTSPGGGICLKNHGLVITTHDVLVQHLRIRPGNEGRGDPDDNDAVAVLGPHGGVAGASNVVLDHLSASWAEDEVVSTWFGAHDVTISWCLISEALNRSRHRKGTHSAGLLVGGGSYHVSIHHSLLAHNGFRNPLIAGGGTHDVVNNVIYDWGDIPTEVHDADSNTFLNLIGNYYRRGPATVAGPAEVTLDPEPGTPRLFVHGNLGPSRPDANRDDWALVRRGWTPNGLSLAPYRAPSSFPTWPITATPAQTALEQVLARAGAVLPRRDAVDRRIAADVTAGSGTIIDSPAQVGGYPALDSAVSPPDSDHDGLPDDWETARGLNPRDPSDGPLDRDADGYTNLEEYLQSLG